MSSQDEIKLDLGNEEQEILMGEGRMMREMFDFVKDLVIIVGLVLIIRTFLVLPFQINGHSMDDSYYDREFIIVNRFSYLDIPFIKTGAPERGDVVVFKPNVNEDKKYYIKRILGMPGDQIKIAEGKVAIKLPENQIFSDIEELYLSEENKNSTFVRGESSAYIFTVPEGSYFVMGDNRIASTDSRTCFSSCMVEGSTNYVPEKDIMGKVLLDLGYFDWIRSIVPLKFGEFRFIHPELGIDTKPRFFSTPSTYEYSIK